MPLARQLAARDADASLARISFLVETFKPQYWWTELFNAGYKVLVTGVVVFLSPGTATQIVMALLISLVALVVQSETHAYIDDADNRLATLSTWTVSIALISAALAFVDASGDGSIEQALFDVVLVVTSWVVLSLGVWMAVEQELVSRWREIRQEHPRADAAEMVKRFLGIIQDDDDDGGEGEGTGTGEVEGDAASSVGVSGKAGVGATDAGQGDAGGIRGDSADTADATAEATVTPASALRI